MGVDGLPHRAALFRADLAEHQVLGDLVGRGARHEQGAARRAGAEGADHDGTARRFALRERAISHRG
ncbi:hypothetical protein GCM10010277_02110 [Streptomyces longisporoflavus]|nr:hypothetical protein GCM10010277_02110 [Streptomyces longisporoflavus]